MDGVTAVAKRIEDGEVWTGSPSCRPTPLIEAAAIAGIRPVVCRQERTGVHMADGFSRITNGNKIGIFLAQNGPGAENSFGGVAQAYADSVPILVLPAGVARNRLGVEPNFHPVQAYSTITKWAAHVNFADRVPELFRQAYTKLRSGKPGPVLLEIPSDLVSDQISEEDFDYVPPMKMRVAADPAAITRGVRALLAARRPVIHAGQGVLYAEATDELMELAEFLQISGDDHARGQERFPENHPAVPGVGGSSQTGQVDRFLTNADVVFGVGVSFTKSGFTVHAGWQDPDPPHQRGEGDINKDHRTDYPNPRRCQGLALSANSSTSSRPRAQQQAPKPGTWPTRHRHPEAWMAEWLPRLTSDEVPLNPIAWSGHHAHRRPGQHHCHARVR